MVKARMIVSMFMAIIYSQQRAEALYRPTMFKVKSYLVAVMLVMTQSNNSLKKLIIWSVLCLIAQYVSDKKGKILLCILL